jgi:hypothetical protein
MKRLLLVFIAAGILGAAAAPSAISAVSPPLSSHLTCPNEQAAVDQAVAAMRAYQPGTLSAAAVRAAKADLQNKRDALKCCRNPKLYGCTK